MDTEKSTDERERAVRAFEQAWFGLSAAQRRLRGRDSKAQGKLSVPQYNLLRPLLDKQPLSAGELSEKAGLTPATATHMLGQLEKNGIVKRRRAVGDRRVVMTELTPKGRRYLNARHEELLQNWLAIIEDLDAAELERSADVLRRMTRYIDGL